MQKVHILLILLCGGMLSANAQGRKEITKADADALGNVRTKNLSFGVSLGFNITTGDVWDAVIAQTDTTLRLERLSRGSFILSTTASVPIAKSKLGGAWYRKLDASGNPTGDPYWVPSGLSIVTVVNLATFNAAVGGSGLFNQRIEGGLGLSWAFADGVQIAATYELLAYRQPRGYIKDLNGSPIVVGSQKITNLSVDDDNYFSLQYIPSFGIKVIYILSK